MPEVCEVTLTALFLKNKIANYTLQKIEILNGKYTRKPLKGLEAFNDELPMTIYDIDSKGKQMWFIMKKGNKFYYVMSHFGMDGRWGFDNHKHANISWLLKDSDGNSIPFYFIDHRNFGSVEFITNVVDFNTKVNSLGPDFLKTEFDPADLKKRIRTLICKDGITIKRKEDKNIVKILMEGQKVHEGIGSGLGNYLVAEILYEAKISPLKTIGEIYKDDILIKNLTFAIKLVTKLSYLTNITGYMEHIKDYVKDIRNKVKVGDAPNYHKNIDIGDLVFSYKVYRKKLDPNGNKVDTVEILKNRNMYWVPDVQL
jgi:formamidopyrimidine-DNA glycosylase